MIRLSAVIITFNEEKNIGRCLESLKGVADEIVVLDVYPAREKPVGPLEGVSGLDVLRATADRAGGRPSYWAPDLDAAERIVRSRATEGAIIATLGAGDVTKLSDRLVAS